VYTVDHISILYVRTIPCKIATTICLRARLLYLSLKINMSTLQKQQKIARTTS